MRSCQNNRPMSEAYFPKCLRRSKRPKWVDVKRYPLCEAPRHTPCRLYMRNSTADPDVTGLSSLEGTVKTVVDKTGCCSVIGDDHGDNFSSGRCLSAFYDRRDEESKGLEGPRPFVLRLWTIVRKAVMASSPSALVHLTEEEGCFGGKLCRQWYSNCCNRLRRRTWPGR